MTSIVKIDLEKLNSGVNQVGSVNELEEVGAKNDGDLPAHLCSLPCGLLKVERTSLQHKKGNRYGY